MPTPIPIVALVPRPFPRVEEEAAFVDASVPCGLKDVVLVGMDATFLGDSLELQTLCDSHSEVAHLVLLV